MTTPAPHVHSWQPNGTVEIDKESCSPVSRWDDLLWRDVISLAVCACGTTRQTRVGSNNVRRRGDDLRKGR